jgi:hypothetical protein
MKHTLINKHDAVNFHDARVNGVAFHGNDMVWELVALANPDSRDGGDCYIKNAVMTLENAAIESVRVDGRPVCDEYDELLTKISYRNFSYIYGTEDLPSADDGRYRMGVMAGCEIVVSFTKSTIEWDEFAGTDWYRGKSWTNGHPN